MAGKFLNKAFFLEVFWPNDPLNTQKLKNDGLKGTSLGENTSFEPLAAKIGLEVWSGRETMKRKGKKQKTVKITQISCPPRSGIRHLGVT